MKRFKSLFYLCLLMLVMIFAQTCKKTPTEEEKITQHEEKIIDKISDFMPEEVVTSYENSLSNLRSESDYSTYLDSLETSIDELKEAVQLNFTLEDFKNALSEAYTDINSSPKSSGSNCLGVGYSKGVRLEVGASGKVALLVAAGLEASGGGGIKIVYDFVNMERQVYYYTICSYGASIGVGLGVELAGKLGFSGINEVITGIRYHGPGIVRNSFAGQSIGLGFSLSGQAARVAGIKLSDGFGISRSAYADFEGIGNLLPCPHNMVEIVNGTKSYSIKVTGTISAGAQADIMVLFSANAIGINTYGIDNSYTHFNTTDRLLEGSRMAKELALSSAITGLSALPNRIDLAAAAAAIVYSHKDFSKCTPEMPAIGTLKVTSITSTEAMGGGYIKNNGGSNVTSRGVCWSTSTKPTTLNNPTTDGTGEGEFNHKLTGLLPNTKYYIRAYATNSVGTAYGTEENFTTLPTSSTNTFTDSRDGHVYKYVTIGTQTWMAENLAYLPSVNPSSSGSSSSARYYVNGYQGINVTDAKATSNYQTYGVLYNWPAANNGCPTGWHLPTSTEFATLATYLGGDNISGGKLKEAGTTHWNSPNTGATNETGFTALPSGVRLKDGTFADIGITSHYWSSTLINSWPTYWGRDLIYNNSNFLPNDFNSDHGLSVRCIKN